MSQSGEEASKLHAKIKDNIKQSHEYFRENNKRYHAFKKFLSESTLTDGEVIELANVQKPPMQFNICSAFVSRQCGEFSKTDPGFSVRAEEMDAIDIESVAFVEAHMKSVFTGANKDSFAYKIYKDILMGGFTVAEIMPEYKHARSFDYCIKFDIVFDPTMTGFDPLARLSHKGDGQYCWQLYPKTRDEAIEIFGSDVIKGMKFQNSSADTLSWSYKSQHQDIVLIGDYFMKKMKKVKLLKIAGGDESMNGKEMTEDEFEKKMSSWTNPLNYSSPIVVKQRKTELPSVERYRLCGTQVLDHTKTDFTYLPLVFFDGNSEMIRVGADSVAKQVTLPYIYQAYDAQRMKNFAGQTMVNDIENMVMHKWMMCVEGIPENEDYRQAITNNQIPTVILYNAFKNNDPMQPLPAPREVARVPMPPEVVTAFQISDNLIQTILGSYDAAIGVNGNDISGEAIKFGAMQSNTAALPYMVGFLNGWEHLGQIYLDLLPKYYNTPRTIPIVTPEGKHEYQRIDDKTFDYDPNVLKVSVTAGVNFEVQKQIALKTIEHLMQASEEFNKFINAEGTEELLDNIDIRNVEQLKVKFAKWSEGQKQQQQQMQERQSKLPLPEELAVMQVQNETKKIQTEAMLGMAKVKQQDKEVDTRAKVDLIKISTDDAVKNKQADIDLLEVMAKIEGQDVNNVLEQEKVDAENTRSAVEMAISVSAHQNEIKKSNEEE